jgi:hypothetical protein
MNKNMNRIHRKIYGIESERREEQARRELQELMHVVRGFV